MKPVFLLFVILVTHQLSGQIHVAGTVISSAGHYGQNSSLMASGTLGETFIFSRAGDNLYWGQGFQSNNLSGITSVFDTDGNAFDIKLFPNPSADRFYIETDAPIAEILLHSMTGQPAHNVLSYTGGGVDISALPPGVYAVYVLIAGGKTYPAGRIVKINN
jgi:hypothetical protein